MSTPETIAQTPTDNNQQEQGTSYIKYGFFIFIISIIVKSFANPDSDLPKVRNMIDNNDLLDIHFYISNKSYVEEEDQLRAITPVFSILNVKYSNISEFPKDIVREKEVEFNYTFPKHLENRTGKINENLLFLYTFIKLKDTRKQAYIRKIFSSKVFINKIKIFKHVEKMQSKIREMEMNNDIDSATYSNSTSQIDYYDDNLFVKDLYYSPELTLYLITSPDNEDPMTFEQLRVMKIDSYVNYHTMKFLPKDYLSDFWTTLKRMKTVKKGENTLKIKLSFGYLSNFYYKFLAAILINTETMEGTFQMSGVKDNLVELFKNNSIQYLVLIFTVNLLHSVFSFLGFANDISYYKNLESLDGLYTKYLYYNLFHYAVAFIYFYIEGSSYIIMVELLVGTLIEFWKFKKIFKVEFSREFKYFIKVSHIIKFQKKKSKDYEDEAVEKSMKYIMMPIAVVYLAYRIYHYQVKKSVFKFIIEYIFFLLNIFGFVLLTPQVYLNYKLKSVYHLPLKVLSYRFLNTIIDDLFAFALDTPTLYRVSVFKDDIIFVIYIYQMIIYRKNKRIVSDEEEEKQLAEEAKKLLPEAKNDENKESIKEKEIENEKLVEK